MPSVSGRSTDGSSRLHRFVLQTELFLLFFQLSGETESFSEGGRQLRRLLGSLGLQFLPAVNQLGGELRAELGDDDVAVSLADVVQDGRASQTLFLSLSKSHQILESQGLDGSLHVVVAAAQQLGNLAAAHGQGGSGRGTHRRSGCSALRTSPRSRW